MSPSLIHSTLTYKWNCVNEKNKKASCQECRVKDLLTIRVGGQKKDKKRVKRNEANGKDVKKSTFYDANELWPELNTMHYPCCMLEDTTLAIQILRNGTFERIASHNNSTIVYYKP